MNKLLETKEMYKNIKNGFIKTKNKNTGWVGVATFYNDKEIIKVFEGNPDGSDDKEYTYEEFIKNYNYELKEEK